MPCDSYKLIMDLGFFKGPFVFWPFVVDFLCWLYSVLYGQITLRGDIISYDLSSYKLNKWKTGIKTVVPIWEKPGDYHKVLIGVKKSVLELIYNLLMTIYTTWILKKIHPLTHSRNNC